MILAAFAAIRFLHFAALVFTAGAAAALAVTVHSSTRGSTADTAFRSRMQRTLCAFSALLLPAIIGVFLIATVNIAGEPGAAFDPDALVAVAGETEFGRVWTVRLMLAAALAGLAAARLRAPPHRGWDAMAALLAFTLLASLALTGHAAVRPGAPGLLHRLSDAAHLTAAGVWLGALPPFLHLLRISSGFDRSADARTTARRLEAFHAIGLVAVLTLIVTGLINSWFLVLSPANLVRTPYGLLLLLKLLLFAGMVVSAGANRLRLVPALSQALRDGGSPDHALAALRRSILAEWLLAVGVLIAVSALGVLEPASAVL